MKKIQNAEIYFVALLSMYILSKTIYHILKVINHIYIQINELVAGIALNSESSIIVANFPETIFLTFVEYLVIALIALGLFTITKSYHITHRA